MGNLFEKLIKYIYENIFVAHETLPHSLLEGIDINPISSAQQEMRSHNVHELRLLNWQIWVKIQTVHLTQARLLEP